MSNIFGDIEGVEVIVDDLLIWAENEENPKESQTAKPQLNRAKSQITYIGHVLTKDSLKPDPSKVEAIATMEAPGNKEDIQRFLGMITYLGKFIPNLSQSAAPLRALLR